MAPQPARWLFAVAVAIVAALCLTFRYLPMVDLPQHYAMVSIFAHYRDPAYGFASRYTFDLLGRPYATVYLAAAALASFLPLAAAMRIVVAACTVAPLAGAYAFIAAIGRPRHLALLAVPFAFGALWFWGFLNFLLGTGLCLGTLALVVRAAKTGSRRALVGLGALALLLLFTHVHGVFMLLALAPPFAWAYRREGDGPRAIVRTLLPLAPTALGTALFVLVTWRQAVGSWPAMNPGFVERLVRFPDFLAAGLPAPWPLASTIALALVVAGAFALRDRDERLPRRQLAAITAGFVGQVLLYFVLPLNTSTATFVSARHALLGVLFLLPLLPSARGGRRTVMLVASCAFALAGLIPAGLALRRFDREARDFDPILAAMKPNRRVAPLIFDKGSPALHPSTFPYLHFAGYYQAARGGDLARSFAVVWNVPVRYRDSYARHALREEVEWQPRLFSLDGDLPYYDYLLIRARGPVHLPSDRGLVTVAASGPWTLVENTAVRP